MKRVLFVDDEPRILEGLQRMLRSQRADWEMTFALGGEAALGACEERSFDVVISDMRMPGMDGAALLTRIQDLYPETVRIILSGHTDIDVAARSARAAHQFLMKPTNADVLKAVINTTFSQRSKMPNEAFVRAVGELDRLPVVPMLYAEITSALNEVDAPIKRISEILSRDAGMTAKVLQLVNSSFFGFSHSVSSLRKAVDLMGTGMLTNLVLSVEVFRMFSMADSCAGFSPETQQAHAIETGRVASKLVEGKRRAEEALTAGLLHDIGKLVLADRMGPRYSLMIQEAKARAVPLHLVEEENLGVTHAEVGAYLLGLWNLPPAIVEVVAFHHSPLQAGSSTIGPLSAVHLANALVHERESPPEIKTSAGIGMDAEYLAQTGLIEFLAEIRSRFATPQYA